MRVVLAEHLNPEFILARQEHVVFADFPRGTGKRGGVAHELAAGREGEPAAVFAA